MYVKGLDDTLDNLDSYLLKQKTHNAKLKLVTGKDNRLAETFIPVLNCGSVLIDVSKIKENKYRILMKGIEFSENLDRSKYKLKASGIWGIPITKYNYGSKKQIKRYIIDFLNSNKHIFIGQLNGIKVFSHYMKNIGTGGGEHVIFGVLEDNLIFMFLLKVGDRFFLKDSDFEAFSRFSLTVDSIDMKAHVLILKITTDYDTSLDFYFPINIVTGDFDEFYSDKHYEYLELFDY